jgi:hypothetical protein
MKIALLLFLASVGEVVPRAVCPAASTCKGCCATDAHYSKQCAKIAAQPACEAQIVCHWTDGPNATMYNALDDFLNVDEDFYSCYESANLTKLIGYMCVP